jgi:hypothetical protein
MPTKITITKEWADELVRLADELSLIKLNDNCQACRERNIWISYLLGYVHSLDRYLKE